MQEFAGKVAVISGGAGGLAAALAAEAAGRGMKIVLCDLEIQALEAAAAALLHQFPGVEVMRQVTDVTRLVDQQALADAVMARFGRVDLVFNNAGVAHIAPVWEATEDDWRWVMSVNVMGVVFGVRVFTPLLIAQGGGHIVNTASAAGLMNTPGQGVYCASKAAVVALSESLLLDLRDAEAPVGVSVLCPAFFPTGISQSERNRPAALSQTAPDSPLRLKRKAQLAQAVQRGRLSAADVARTTFEAVMADRFYILPHQGIKPHIAARTRALIDAGTFYDPYAARPA